MANHVVLNNVEHKHLHIAPDRAEAYGDRVMCTLTFPDEFRSVQAHYPIFFRKAEDGSFQSLAMFGFEEGENLFLTDDGWDAHYVPLTIERQPFLIGFQQREGETSASPIVHIDMDSPRIVASDVEGAEPVFLEHGGYTDYLNRISEVLATIHDGFQRGEAFNQVLREHDLLESFTLDVELNDGSQYRLGGFYTVNEEKLHALDGTVLSELSESGYLACLYMAIASLSQIRALIERRNQQLEG
ncbi:MAG: SapC family protein [Pseudomonadota bacterium]